MVRNPGFAKLLKYIFGLIHTSVLLRIGAEVEPGKIAED